MRTLHAVLSRVELTLKLAPGDALLLDNHRVMHGRHAFRGYRNMLGCYLGSDDWRSRLRVLRHGAASPDGAG